MLAKKARRFCDLCRSHQSRVWLRWQAEDGLIEVISGRSRCCESGRQRLVNRHIGADLVACGGRFEKLSHLDFAHADHLLLGCEVYLNGLASLCVFAGVFEVHLGQLQVGSQRINWATYAWLLSIASVSFIQCSWFFSFDAALEAIGCPQDRFFNACIGISTILLCV